MQPNQPENVPGNHQSGAAALQALTELSALLLAARDCRLRLDRAVNDVDALIYGLQHERNYAVSAIELFAEIAPGSFGRPTGEENVRQECADLDERTTALLRDAEAVVARASGGQL